MTTDRKPTIWVETWTELQALRCVRLLRLGRYAEPEQQPIARVAAVLKHATGTLLAIAESNDGTEAGAVMLELAWEEYLRDEWALSLSPSFPLSAFSNSTVLQRCWAAAEKRIAEEASLLRLEAKR
jgi:hypothetical protein